MSWSFSFIVTSVMLGVGLAMDAFSVSLANGLNEPHMPMRRMGLMAGIFAFFQALMPMLGWVFVHTIVEYFNFFGKLVPWIALILLAYIGGKMLIEGIRCNSGEAECCNIRVAFGALIVQGIATSIDALSVGFTISEYNWLMALVCAIIMAVVTFVICSIGLFLGKKFGTALSGKASILGGVILIAIGLEIFITGVFF